MGSDNINKLPCMIGTWAWGSGMNGSKMVFGKSYDKEQLFETFKKAYDNGLLMWDTASVYGHGNSEKILGEFIKRLECKDKLYISTKHFPDGKYTEGEMSESLNGSMQRLNIEVPDIYWIHHPKHLDKDADEGIQLLKQNKIKALGLSNVSIEQIKTQQEKLNKEGFSIGGIQNHYSLLSRDNG